MEMVKADKDQLVVAVEAVTNQLCAVLRSVSDPDVRAVGTWTVRDVGAHLASGVPLYTGIVRGEGSTYTRLDGIAEFNAAGVAAITDRDCTTLAGRIESAVAEFVTANSGAQSFSEATAVTSLDGKTIFKAKCGGCHTLADAGTTGTTGPHLDQLKPPFARVQKQVINGGVIMPAFKGILTDAQIRAVAQYVSSHAGKK